MRIPQISILLVLSCILLTSCKKVHTKYEDTENQEKSTPSSKENHDSESIPKKDYQVPTKSSDSISKKRKKSMDLDTLKPKMALLIN